VPLGATDLALKGTVEEIASASRRIRLALEWMEGGTVLGKGWASTLVNEPMAAGISSATIRELHLATGLQGKVALITGASRGIGEATAKLIALHGAKVAIHYFQGKTDAEAIVDDIKAQGGRAAAVCADLRNEENIAEMFGQIQQQLGKVDILVNNAVGEFVTRAFDSLTSEDFMRELQVTLFGVHQCCRLALPHMRAKKWGKIINFGTTAIEKTLRSVLYAPSRM